MSWLVKFWQKIVRIRRMVDMDLNQSKNWSKLKIAQRFRFLAGSNTRAPFISRPIYPTSSFYYILFLDGTQQT